MCGRIIEFKIRGRLSVMKKVFITIDVEQDCPPYLSTTDGMKYGMPKLLDLFQSKNIAATFFTTGEMAQQFPDLMHRIINEGHELGCHGQTHRKFSDLSETEAAWEITQSAKILREYGKVISFRAPYLNFPDSYLPLLAKHGFLLDSSIPTSEQNNREKLNSAIIKRIAPTLPSSCFRLPRFLFMHKIRRQNTIMLFMHPWEFIDMSKRNIRFDRRLNTGEYAINNLKKWIRFFKKRQYQFLKCDEVIAASSLHAEHSEARV